jgi:predicted aldo/keto reductase-like oxidoreductase
MEFCQIQLNYLDWSLQYAKEKVELLEEFGNPVWVMEPVRGGSLARLDADFEARMKQLRPEESVAAWSFRFLQGMPQVKMILSGMSRMSDVQDNVRSFAEPKPLSDAETQLLMEIAEGMKNSVPCTACRYCCSGCPAQLDIPMLLAAYNEVRFALSPLVRLRMELLLPEQRPDACLACGKCSHICPQNIDVPAAMADLVEKVRQCPV